MGKIVLWPLWLVNVQLVETWECLGGESSMLLCTMSIFASRRAFDVLTNDVLLYRISVALKMRKPYKVG